MNRLCPCLLLPLLAIAACKTERKPLIGFDEPPPGSFILGPWNEGNAVRVWPIFELPYRDTFERFRFRLNGQVVVYMTSDEGFYDYATPYLQGWTSNGFPNVLSGLPSATYTVELTDSAGQIWGRSAPLLIASGGVNSTSSSSGPQLPTIVFTHFDAQIGSWNIDPTTQDSDAATDEIAVTNLVDEDVVVERCLIAAGDRSSCTLVGTVAPGADLLTVERVAAAQRRHQRCPTTTKPSSSTSPATPPSRTSGTSPSGAWRARASARSSGSSSTAGVRFGRTARQPHPVRDVFLLRERE